MRLRPCIPGSSNRGLTEKEASQEAGNTRCGKAVEHLPGVVHARKPQRFDAGRDPENGVDFAEEPRTSAIENGATAAVEGVLPKRRGIQAKARPEFTPAENVDASWNSDGDTA